MITLLASILLSTSLLAPSDKPSELPVTYFNGPQAVPKSAVSNWSGGFQHVRQWPGTSGDGRVRQLRGNEVVHAPRLTPGSSITPVSTVTLLQGWFVQYYTDTQWQQLFQALAAEGVTSVVFATSVDESEGSGQVLGQSSAYPADIATARYPVSSTVTSTFSHVSYPGNASGASRSPVEECLYYAQHNNVNNSMAVYVGLNFYPDEWNYRSGNTTSGYSDPITDSTFCTDEADLGALVAEDLNNQFGSYSSFAGWYWPWEVDNVYFDKNIGSSDYSFLPSGYATSAYNNLITMLETSFYPLSAKPRIISPYFNPYYVSTEDELPYTAYSASEYGTLWQQIFSTTYEGSSLFNSSDVFAPQDGAGDYQPAISSGSSLQGPPSISTIESNIDTWYPPLLQAASTISGMSVWANAETYQVDVQAYGAPYEYVENDPAYPSEPWVDGAYVNAGVGRVSAQLQTEAAVNYSGTYYLGKIMNCSNAYYYDPIGVWANSAWNTAWNGWLQNQTLGNSGGPSAPVVTGPTVSSGHVQFNLSVNSSPNGVCGYDIWRDSYTAGTTPYVLSQIRLSTSSSTAFTDPDSSSAGGSHTYYVAAFDVYGNLSTVTEFMSDSGASLSLNPPSLAGGTPSTATVTLSSPAPSGGVTFTLNSKNSNATVPSSVTVPYGSSSTTFTVTTTSVSTAATATLTATSGSTSLTAALQINPLTVAAVSVSPASVDGGSSSTGTVTLNGQAPSGGTVVILSSSSSNATVPSSVTIAAGSTSAIFTVSTSSVSTNTYGTITGTLSGSSLSATSQA